MKVIRYKHVCKPIVVVKGIPQESKQEIEQEYFFTLSHDAMRLFEQEHGKPLLKSILSMSGEVADNFDATVIQDLAAASYIDVEGSNIINNEITVEKFKQTELYKTCSINTDFMDVIMELIKDFIPEQKKEIKSGKKTKK
ncbi:MAG: hypothetical protein RR945_02150 [Erysipelotrichaceae bacterium]